MNVHNKRKSTRLPVHSPVRRLFADRYLLITLLSFAASVTITRLFLNVTGFPRLGVGELHIAHMLWGGLLLFAAALLPLIFANRWFLGLSAFLSGVGVGLFIDEVGKFITSQNNYFFPAAAPIIYAFFLLTLLIYSLVRRGKKLDQRSKFYLALERLEDVVDHDLTTKEKQEIIDLLTEISIQKEKNELNALADTLSIYLQTHQIHLVAEKPSWWQELENKWMAFESRTFNRTKHRFFLLLGILLWSGLTIMHAYLSWLFSKNHTPLPWIFSELINNQLPLSTSGIGLPELRIFFEIAVGVFLFISFLLFIFHYEKRAAQLAATALLFSICIVYLFIFYFEQFSSIFYALLQFILLMILIRYQARFLEK